MGEYHLRGAGHEIAARNPAQNFSAQFTPTGVTFTCDPGHWRMALRAWGYGNTLELATRAKPAATKNRMEYRHGFLTEWYVNGPAGLEQGFVVKKRPRWARGHDLQLVLALSGKTIASDNERRGVDFTDDRGRALLHYGGLAAWDANGEQVPAAIELRAAKLVLRMDDKRAFYPITIDPIIQQAKLTSSDSSADFGMSVAISGKTIVVGAPLSAINGNAQQGAAYIFVEPASGWGDMTQTAKLTASDGTEFDEFGFSVGIDGDTIAIGAPQASNEGGPSAGAVYIFVKPTAGWSDMTQTAELNASDEGSGSYFGGSVAISGNTVVAAGVNEQGNGSGTGYVFVEPASGWQDATENADLFASNGNIGAITIRDNTVVGGAASFHDWQGAVYIFVQPTGGWQDMTETAVLTASDGRPDDDFGAAIAMSGSTLVVGAPEDVNGTGCNCGPGKAYVFVKPSTGWVTGLPFTAELKTHAPSGFAAGYSVAVHGPVAVVGSWPVYAPRHHGAAFIFVEPRTGWQTTSTPDATLVSDDSVNFDDFGSSVAVGYNGIVCGANAALDTGKRNGAVYIFGKQ